MDFNSVLMLPGCINSYIPTRIVPDKIRPTGTVPAPLILKTVLTDILSDLFYSL